ncbi:hypothetical protein [Dyadobacter sediminis]|uniref:Uncharacterized protein n=1 Tax=Dyadobacter sediminis TaxID=1493691 RepID=A0A5R9KBB2_9BACT|nr:hypothetical protein [Dyadobacter sediminis]TLU92007.1 hypothetical protein FEM55_14700 [Dyadobacter sediminis]GGB98268.1 hypothetical protein GCM10011325_26970 [Dyadobacter sediminis]
MTTLELLRKKLQIHNRDCHEIPTEDPKELKRRLYIKRMYWLQIECEEFRNAINLAFRLCSQEPVKEIVDDLEIVKMRTVFKWEEWKDAQILAINEKEATGLEFFKTKILELPNDKQAKV